ncbi:thioredoxin family protein [Tenacibaculum amylolyticum]|uniref:thioredoxin family protein n=1 Tax=Tenacibaculum amylolyticum TaxID=104269 RepID=UPI0038957E4B
MNKTTYLILLLLVCNIANGQLNKTITDKKGKRMLLGKVDKKGFKHADFSWFQKNYEDYLVNDKIVDILGTKLKDYKIKVFFGSWCGDSKREVPKFYKVLTKAEFDNKNLALVAVDRKPEAYKASPSGEEKGLNIHRVPTFIFYKGDKEIGRIVEYPKEDFERDMLKIVQEQKYTSNYAVVTYLDKVMKDKGVEELANKLNFYAKYVSEYVKGSKELNTYGYKLLRSGQLKKALVVFELNTLIFPYKANVFDSYAEALFEAKEYQKSLKNYGIALSFEPQNKEIIERINSIKTMVN